MKEMAVSSFGGDPCSSRLVIWPVALSVLAPALAAYQARSSAVALAGLALATLVRVTAGARQWRVIPRAVFPLGPPRAARAASSTGEDSPRLTSRGITAC